LPGGFKSTKPLLASYNQVKLTGFQAGPENEQERLNEILNIFNILERDTSQNCICVTILTDEKWLKIVK